MILPLAVRLLRYSGWAVMLASVGIVVATVACQSAFGPEADQRLWPTPRLWKYFGNTLWMAAAATAFALILALPAAFALVLARRRWQRSLLYGLTVIPLLTMPSIFAYAWMLLATSRNALIAKIILLIGWNTPGAEVLQSSLVLATWLWPIPALILATGFRHVGARAYQLASIDASPIRAFCRAALPVMRAPVIAALAAVFILSAIDSTVAPLMNATQVWSVEMLANASIASRFERPAAYLFWYSWPLLATLGIIATAAAPGIRQMADWADDPETTDIGTTVPAGAWTWLIACLIAAGITLFPILVFTLELATGRTTPAQAMETAWKTSGDAALATLMVAGLTALGAMALAVAALDEPTWPMIRRVVAGTVTVLAVTVAVLPPELTATALASFFSNAWISPPNRWNLYDNTPLVWTAAMVARFGFIPVAVLRLLNRRVPADLTAQARTDGADRMQRLAYAHLPILWRPLLAAGLMVACLTISEAAASVLVQAPQFFGGSLAVHVDSLMHYGRQNETIAMSLMLILPAVLIAIAVPLLAKLPTLRRRPSLRSVAR